MRFIKSRGRSYSVMAIAVALMAMIGIVGAGPVQATTLKPAVLGNCGQLAASDDRLCYLADGTNNPDFYWVVLHVKTGADGHDYAWGEADAALDSWVYLDVSHDGGNTWTGWQNQGRNTTEWWEIFPTSGSPLYDGPGTWIRACGVGDHSKFLCTGWN